MNDQLTEPIDSYEDDLFAGPPPAWPKWIGGLAIAWGGLGLPCTGIASLGLVFQEQMVQQKISGAPMPEVIQNPGLEWVVMIAGLVLTVVLLFGGIFCVMRSPVSRLMILGWGILSLLLSLWSYTIQTAKFNSLQEWAKLYPDTQYAQEINMMSGGIGQGVILGMTILFGVIIPGFFIIWFGFIKTKPEQMTGSEEVIA